MPSPASAATSSHSDYHQQTARPMPAVSLVYGVVILYLLLLYFNHSLPPPQSILWDTIVHLIPQRLLLHQAQRQELQAKSMLSQTHALKTEALRGMLGLGGSAFLSRLPSGASEGIDIMRRASSTMFSRPQVNSDRPPGLGNWDNSCYQNVVLQGLASLTSLRPYLDRFRGEMKEDSTSTTLLGTVRKLNDEANNGQQLWTPAKLKSMSSWQQQDAQEYYSKILDEIDKETTAAQRTVLTSQLPGLESLAEDTTQLARTETPSSNRSPLDGLLAQKVTCTRCGFSEGLSMIPFNCLTLPLPVGCNVTDVQQCLDEYTQLEDISEVECAKCTLLRAEQQLVKMLPANPGFQSTESPSSQVEVETNTLQLPPELRVQAFKRLAAIQAALERDDFADKTLQETCQLSKKARVSTTKTKSACIARPPKCLVVHVNRSVFDEQTGMQRKNYARVQYPLTLDLTPWMLDDGQDETVEADEPVIYRLKAVVTHYGRHENGHYICYRQHPVRRKVVDAIEDDEMDVEDEELSTSIKDPWYRLSDEDVSPVGEDDVLGQGGVFMLFYERESVPETPLAAENTVENDNGTAVQSEMQALDEEDAAILASAAPTSSSELDLEESPTATEQSVPDPATATTGQQIDATMQDGLPNNANETAPDQEGPWISSSASPLVRMRTARLPVIDKEFGGNAFRAVAAS